MAKKKKKKITKKTSGKKGKASSKKKAPKIKVSEDGSKNYLKGSRKLDAKIVEKIRKNFKNGDGMVISAIHAIVVEKGYDVTYASVRNVCIRATWRHLA